MKTFLIQYFVKTGAIFMSTVVEDDPESQSSVIFSPIDGTEICRVKGNDVHPNTHYIDGTDIKAKTTFPELTVNNGLITGIPIDSICYWPDGVETVETDGSIEIESNVSSNFEFKFTHGHYFDLDITVTYNV